MKSYKEWFLEHVATEPLSSLLSGNINQNTLTEFADSLSEEHGDAMHALITMQKPSNSDAAYLAWNAIKVSPRIKIEQIKPSGPNRSSMNMTWIYNPDLRNDFCNICDRLSDSIQKSGGVTIQSGGSSFVMTQGNWYKYQMDGSGNSRGDLSFAEKIHAPYMNPENAFYMGVATGMTSGIIKRNVDVSLWR